MNLSTKKGLLFTQECLAKMYWHVNESKSEVKNGPHLEHNQLIINNSNTNNNNKKQ